MILHDRTWKIEGVESIMVIVATYNDEALSHVQIGYM
jgi:hypothetical protein